jgi:hypothetical protein
MIFKTIIPRKMKAQKSRRVGCKKCDYFSKKYSFFFITLISFCTLSSLNGILISTPYSLINKGT